jgi:hypothetical protein
MNKIALFILVPTLLFQCFTGTSQQNVSITIDAGAAQRPISPYIYGKNNNLSDAPASPLTANQWQRLRDLGITMFRENGGNNATKYNWRRKLSSHPDWYNNVYSHDWDYAAKSLQANIPAAQGMWAFQLIGKAAKTKTANFSDWTYNHSQWWEGVAQNLCGGGQVNETTNPKTKAKVEGDTSKYLENWSADSTTGILDHWFGAGGLGLNPNGIKYWSMDNEPEIWEGTHDDVYPVQPGAEEFMQKYFEVAKKARAAYPEIKLVGPVPANEWQWFNWKGGKVKYSGKEYPWLEYFILRIAEEQELTGIRLLDVLDIHFYPGEVNSSDIVQLHRVFFDETYDYPGANGVKRSGPGGWDNSITKEYIFKRCKTWLENYMGADNGVGLSVSEVGIGGDNPNVTASWYASTLGEFAKQGVEMFTPWSWKTGMDEVIHLFSKQAQKFYVDGVSSEELYVSAYPTENVSRDTMTIFLVNRHLTESRTADLNLKDFRVKNGTYSLYTLSGLPQSETFVSASVNALKKTNFQIAGNIINVPLSPLSVSALVLVKDTTAAGPYGDYVTGVEAETGTLTGVNISTSVPGYSGTGYVSGFDNANDKVTVHVTVPEKGLYRIVIRYLATSGEKYQYLSVNDGFSSPVRFPASNTFALVDAGGYIFEQGSNSITVSKSWGWSDVDKFEIYTTQKNTYHVTPDLVDTAASVETKALYGFLLSRFGNNIISGQTHDYYDEIKNLTGSSPMLRAGDLQHFTDGYPYLWQDGHHTFGKDDDGTVDELISWYNSTDKKGIVSLQWHWHSPTGGAAGTNTFYTDQTTFDVTKAVTPGTQENTDILRDIDDIAVQLKRFEDAGVPILWRPLHEAGGGWFWWGAKGPEACLALYDLLYNRLQNYHHLHNLIWVWSTPETDWYPGNDKVDIVGYDSYPGSFNYGNQKNAFDILHNLTGGEKLVAMSENGPIPNPDECLDLDAPWSYFMSWSDLVVQQNTTEHLLDVYSNPRVLKFETPVVHDQFNVKFKVSNHLTLQPLWGASVTLDSITQSTDGTGETVFTKEGGSYSYAIGMPSYQGDTGTVSVHSDTTFFVYLVQTQATVKFRLKNGTAPVKGATVTVEEQSLVSNSLGMATFSQLPVLIEYSYIILKTGFNDEAGSFYLSKDTTIDVVLGLKTVVDPAEQTEALKIWPNPAYEQIYISFPAVQNEVSLRITDLGGHELYKRKLENHSLTLDVKDFMPGMYIIHLVAGNETKTGYFIKQ